MLGHGGAGVAFPIVFSAVHDSTGELGPAVCGPALGRATKAGGEARSVRDDLKKLIAEALSESSRREALSRALGSLFVDSATRGDAAVLTITFLSTLLLNIEFAIYVGVLLSIGLHLATVSHPRIRSVMPDLNTGKMVESEGGETCCQMEILFIEGSIFFGSADFVLDNLQRRLRNHPGMANLLIRMHKVNTMDASGVNILEILLEEIQMRGGGLFLAGINHRVFKVLKNSGLLNEVGVTHIHTSTEPAIRRAMCDYFYPDICAACPVFVFRECPDLKRGNWEIFGQGVQPLRRSPEEYPGQKTIDASEKNAPLAGDRDEKGVHVK